MSPGPTVTPCSRSAASRSARNTCSPGSSHGTPEQARDVEQHSTADEAVLEDVDRSVLGARGGQRGLRMTAVEQAVEDDVGEGVDVAVPFVVVVGADVVLGEAHASGADVDVRHHRHAVVRRAGVVDALLRVERLAERDRDAAANEPGGRATRSGVRWLSAPRSACSPQRSQLQTAWKSARNSLAVMLGRGRRPHRPGPSASLSSSMLRWVSV